MKQEIDQAGGQALGQRIKSWITKHFSRPSARRWGRGRAWLGLGALCALLLQGCDPLAIAELEEGVSTEADVVQRFGQPERVWDEPGGARTLEYNRQPAGVRNYMITVGPDGVMTALRQVLTPENFARVQVGMDEQTVRRMLGRPAHQVFYELAQEHAWRWNFLEPPSERKAFYVVFGLDRRVLRTEIGPDPEGPDMRGGA